VNGRIVYKLDRIISISCMKKQARQGQNCQVRTSSHQIRSEIISDFIFGMLVGFHKNGRHDPLDEEGALAEVNETGTPTSVKTDHWVVFISVKGISTPADEPPHGTLVWF